MEFGELKKHSSDYRNGHHTGTVRAYDSAIYDVASSEADTFTKQEIIDLLRESKVSWLNYCDIFGMGIELRFDSYDDIDEAIDLTVFDETNVIARYKYWLVRLEQAVLIDDDEGVDWCLRKLSFLELHAKEFNSHALDDLALEKMELIP